MTFKHIKFDESEIMKNFEQVAKEKGLVKSEKINKEASTKKDYKPTDNLIINLIKLCDGLRTIGLEKYAAEIEEDFVMYKKASSLYETQKETGEDLIDEAHPKGSHKLEGVDGDAIIETIIDQQKKDMEIVNKKPTGKLTNAKDIINAVKIVLAQNISEEQKKILDQIPDLVQNVIKEINESQEPFANYNPERIIKHVEENKYNIYEMQRFANSFYSRFDPSWYGAGASDILWKIIQPDLSKIKTLAKQAFDIKYKTNTQQSYSQPSNIDKIKSDIQINKNKLISRKNTMKTDAGKAWVDKTVKWIDDHINTNNENELKELLTDSIQWVNQIKA